MSSTNTNQGRAVNKSFGPNPTLNEETSSMVLQNVVLSHFFKNNPRYIKELTKKANELENDATTPLGHPDLLQKLIKVTLHQQVIYCDDSSSMRREGRWDAQVQLVNRIAQITTRILPEGSGIALRFINHNVDRSGNLTLPGIEDTLRGMTLQAHGADTPIGTGLRSKILEPLIYDQLQRKTLRRPYLITVMTDGMPSHEKDDAFVEAIKECGIKLEQAGYPRKSVKFLIGQIGTGKSVAKFLQDVGNNPDIKDVVFATKDQLDERLSALRNEGDLDRWLLETLYKAINFPPQSDSASGPDKSSPGLPQNADVVAPQPATKPSDSSLPLASLRGLFPPTIESLGVPNPVESPRQIVAAIIMPDGPNAPEIYSKYIVIAKYKPSVDEPDVPVALLVNSDLAVPRFRSTGAISNSKASESSLKVEFQSLEDLTGFAQFWGAIGRGNISFVTDKRVIIYGPIEGGPKESQSFVGVGSWTQA